MADLSYLVISKSAESDDERRQRQERVARIVTSSTIEAHLFQNHEETDADDLSSEIC
jgi:hypothetical protein